jgi:hemerythrin-like domain-containing protein
MASFTRMYRPHAAREDTVLYPAFRSVISPKEFMALGATFENKEERLFGENGFEKIVGQVADLEKQLGIYQLTQFTPEVSATGSQS